MKLQKRLSSIEKQFSLSEKNNNSELEMILSINDDQEIEASHFRVYQDGWREPIGKVETDTMMEHDDHCDVMIV